MLALSPWLFGFADDGTQFWLPFVVIGVAAIFLGLTTKQAGGYSYGRAEIADYRQASNLPLSRRGGRFTSAAPFSSRPDRPSRSVRP